MTHKETAPSSLEDYENAATILFSRDLSVVTIVIFAKDMKNEKYHSIECDGNSIYLINDENEKRHLPNAELKEIDLIKSIFQESETNESIIVKEISFNDPNKSREYPITLGDGFSYEGLKM